MNLAKTCPDIPDNWRGNIADTCRVLGGEKPLSRDTLKKYALLGRREGGIDWKPKRGLKSGMTFSGKEVKRFWMNYS